MVGREGGMEGGREERQEKGRKEDGKSGWEEVSNKVVCVPSGASPARCAAPPQPVPSPPALLN